MLCMPHKHLYFYFHLKWLQYHGDPCLWISESTFESNCKRKKWALKGKNIVATIEIIGLLSVQLTLPKLRSTRKQWLSEIFRYRWDRHLPTGRGRQTLKRGNIDPKRREVSLHPEMCLFQSFFIYIYNSHIQGWTDTHNIDVKCKE